jgi:hypothetical protein
MLYVLSSAGDREERTVGTVRRAMAGVAAAAAISLATASGADGAATNPLLLSQGTAFSILGYWCGGIQEKAYAIGLNATSDPVGDVYLRTSCSTGRAGSPPAIHTAWAAVVWNYAGAALSASKLTSAPTGLNLTFSVVAQHGTGLYESIFAIVYNHLGSAYALVTAPGAPTGVTATQVEDHFQVNWTPAVATEPIVSSSVVTATPIESAAPVLTATVSGAGSTVPIGPLQPQTTYQITVVNTDPGGSSPPSAITVTTPPSTVPPSVPSTVTAHWTNPGEPGDMLAAAWSEGSPGDSPIDHYQVRITEIEDGSPATFTQEVSGSTLNATFQVNDIPNWHVYVRAHNAAGWGPWSAPFTLGGA